MDELNDHKQAGARIFRAAIKQIQARGWDRNSMDILLAVTPGHKWQQPMAVLMFSELESALGGRTLTQFDSQVQDKGEVIALFEAVADQLSQTSSGVI